MQNPSKELTNNRLRLNISLAKIYHIIFIITACNLFNK